MTEIGELARRIARLETGVRALSLAPRLINSSIENGSIPEYDADGNLVSVIGRQPDGTHGIVNYAGPIPPVPSAPTAEGGPIKATIVWDGTFTSGVAPLDLLGIEVYVAATDFENIEDARFSGRMLGAEAGEITINLPVGVHHVGLVAVSNSYRRSAVSARVAVEATSVADSSFVAELEARLDDAEAAVDAAQAELDGLFEISGDGTVAIDTKIAAVPKVYHSTLDANGAAVDGSTWFKHALVSTPEDLSGQIVGQWTRTAGAWVSTPLRHEVIASIDAGSISVGTLDTARLNALNVAAAVATIIELNADRITSGTIDTVRLNAATIATAVANIIELNADRITSGEIVAGQIGANQVQAEHIAADAITAKHTITGATIQTDAAANTGVKIDTTGMRAFNTSGGQTLEIGSDGTVEVIGEVSQSDGFHEVKLGQIPPAPNSGRPALPGMYLWSPSNRPPSSPTVSPDGLQIYYEPDIVTDFEYLDRAVISFQSTDQAASEIRFGQDAVGFYMKGGHQFILTVDGGLWRDGDEVAFRETDSGWVNPYFYSGYTAHPTHPLKCRKIGNLVLWRGRVSATSGNFPTGVPTRVGTAPVGYRPTTVYSGAIGQASGNVHAKLEIEGGGGIFVYVGGATAFVGFDSMFYRLD